jgi:nucleoside-diphosphate-sugar epimerase
MGAVKKNILLTGATGFLGSHLLKDLIEAGFFLVVLKRKSSSLDRISTFINHSAVRIYNIEETGNFDLLFTEQKIDGIIHVATDYGRNKTLSNTLTSNLIFPIQLCEKAIEHKAGFFINTDTYFSKFPEYEHLNDYIKSKIFLNTALKKFIEQIKLINLKLEHIYGTHDHPDKFVTMLLHKLKNKEPFIDLTEGNQKRDFVYVKDVTKAYLSILNNIETIKSGEHFEIGTGESISIKNFVLLLKEISHSSSQLNFGALANRNTEFPESKANTAKIKALGWSPGYSLNSALKEIVDSEPTI